MPNSLNLLSFHHLSLEPRLALPSFLPGASFLRNKRTTPEQQRRPHRHIEGGALQRESGADAPARRQQRALWAQERDTTQRLVGVGGGGQGAGFFPGGLGPQSRATPSSGCTPTGSSPETHVLDLFLWFLNLFLPVGLTIWLMLQTSSPRWPDQLGAHPREPSCQRLTVLVNLLCEGRSKGGGHGGHDPSLFPPTPPEPVPTSPITTTQPASN